MCFGSNSVFPLIVDMTLQKSFLSEYESVFAFASGTNFYKQCMPKSSVHLAYSSCSVHWLSAL